jgi:DNA-binding CsgD family transcriptional regulator
MMSYPPTVAQHRIDVESELTQLFERILELVNDRLLPPAILHRSACSGIEDQTGQEQILVQIEADGVSYLLVRCSTEQDRTTLSPREQEIVRLVSTGHPNKAIARKLAISQHTVNTHVRRIFDKLGVSSRAEMVAYALQSGLVTHMVRVH